MEQQEMKTVDVTKLEGVALDWLVCTVEGLCPNVRDRYTTNQNGSVTGVEYYLDHYSHSTKWEHGGPLLEKHCIELTIGEDVYFARRTMTNPYESEPVWSGHTMLVAACRAIVGNKFGYLVEVPAKLINR